MSVQYPKNPFTDLIENTARMNALHGRGSPGGEPLPTVQTPAMRNPVMLPDEEPLTAEEKAELDRLALAAGISDPRIEVPVDSDGPYGSMDEALAAGAPVNPPVVPRRDVVLRPGRHIGVDAVQVPVAKAARLPDFSNVQGIDLISGNVYIDDTPFPIADEVRQELLRFAVAVAKDAILAKLDEATTLFTPETVEDLDGGSPTSE